MQAAVTAKRLRTRSTIMFILLRKCEIQAVQPALTSCLRVLSSQDLLQRAGKARDDILAVENTVIAEDDRAAVGPID